MRTPRTPRSRLSAWAFRDVLIQEMSKKSPDFSSWFDLWHRHLDWEGDGDLTRQHRNLALWALFKTLHRFEQETRSVRERCQVFACIHEQEPGSDAIYVHTPNPNGTPFPYEPQVDTWLARAPSWLAGRISLERYDLGMSEHEGKKSYFVQRKRSHD